MLPFEKSMFFIPNRLYTGRDEMYVSFNIADIPTDMEITAMVLHVPIPDAAFFSQITLQEITGGWDEGLMRTGYRPPRAAVIKPAEWISSGEEATFDVKEFEYDWRFKSLENHGIYIKFSNAEGTVCSEEAPPYLLSTTI